MNKSQNWSPVLNRSLSLKEEIENKLKYVIDTLFVETKGLELGIHSELVDEKLGRYDIHADVEEGEEFTNFIVSKEDMKFVMDKLREIKQSQNNAEHAIDLLKGGVTTLPPPADSIFNIENLEKLIESVNHTSHPSGIETIEITRWMNFNLGNSVKYILQSGEKSEESAIQDLEKAVWYINDEIKRLKGEYNK